MERMDHADQHREYPAGTEVFAANGERLGAVREVHPHYLLVAQGDAEDTDLEVPPHSIARYEDGRLYLTVNREALSVVDDEASVARRANNDHA